MSTNELTSKVKELKELKAMAYELASEITTIEDEIKAHMAASGIEEIICGAYKIRWKKVESVRFDTSAFKKTNVELYNQFSKKTVNKHFTIA